MADLAVKLQELKEKVVAEFNAFKNSQNFCCTDPTDSKNLDALLFKVTYEIERIKSDFSSEEHLGDFNGIKESQSADSLIKAQTLAALQELKENIMREFDGLKDHNNYSCTDLTESNNLDTFLFKVKYQIDQMKSAILTGRNYSSSGEIKYKETQSSKAGALIKLQSLANLITCHIISLDDNL